MPVAVTTAVPLGSTSGTNATVAVAPASVPLVTAPTHSKPTYHLMELTPDLVPLFEEAEGSGPRGDGAKRRAAEQRVQDDASSLAGRNSARPSKRFKTLCIKGRNDDEAVLCTDTHTWTVRQMTQSNSLLLCSLDGHAPHVEERCADVAADSEAPSALTVRINIAEVLELVPVVPRMGRIETLLEASAYSGEYDDKTRTKTMRRYTPQQVASIVQASPAELQQGLRQAHVIELDGYLRIVSRSYLTEVLKALLAHLDAHALEHDRVPLRAAVDALMRACELRRQVAEAVLTSWFGAPSEANGEACVALDGVSIVAFLGLQLLSSHAHGKSQPLEAFLDRWTAMVGHGLGHHVDAALLQGSFLMHPAPPAEPTALEPASIEYFAASSLSLDVAQRFQQLFRARAQWIFEDLVPFMADVAVDDKKRDALLLKFARTSQASLPVPETKQERRARKARGAGDKPPMRFVKLYSARLRN